MTDIANEPDDQMSMVRLLVYSNQLDIEGLIATTSTWMRATVRPDVLHKVIAAYGEVRPRLEAQAPGYPTAAALDALVVKGQEGYGMAAVGAGQALARRRGDHQGRRSTPMRARSGCSAGAAPTRSRRRCSTCGARARRPTSRRSSPGCASTRSPIRTTPGRGCAAIFPNLHYIAMPSTQDGEEYYLATWTGISGDRFYRNAPGADFTTFTDAWVARQHPQPAARSARSTSRPAASTRATRRRSSA